MLAYVVRHGESLSNIGSADGLNDSLSPLGRRQADALASRFEKTKLRAIYSSPYVRCIETAAPLASALQLPIRIRPDLCEHHHLEPGTVVDTALSTMDELICHYSGVVPCPDAETPFEWTPADESLDALIVRVQGVAAYLKRRWTEDDDAVLLVSHGSPVARLVEAWLTDAPGPSYRFIIDNCAVSALRFHEGISSLVCLNEVSHLRGQPAPGFANYRSDGSIKTVPSMGYW